MEVLLVERSEHSKVVGWVEKMAEWSGIWKVLSLVELKVD